MPPEPGLIPENPSSIRFISLKSEPGAKSPKASAIAIDIDPTDWKGDEMALPNGSCRSMLFPEDMLHQGWA